MDFDLLVRNGTVVTPNAAAVQDIGVSEGVITAIGPTLGGTAREEMDATGLTVLPGLMDAHVHFNEPGRGDWEGWATGSAAMAAGGGTCVFDMPLNSTPPTADAEAFDRKRAAAEASSVVDFGLWGALLPGNLNEMEALALRGVIGFKAFMSNSGMEDFPRADNVTLLEGMRRAAELGLLVAVHAESEAITSALAARAVKEGRTGVRDYLASRPVIAELEAVGRVILFAEETGCALHIVHVSTGRGVAMVAEARKRGVDVTCETCPHYLALTEDDVERLGAVAKCAPPLRPKADQDALWARVLAGDVAFIASDHSPSPPGLKTSENFFQVWGGIAGCQSTLPLLWEEGVAQRGLGLPELARLMGGGVAERFHIGAKGRLEVGKDADITLVDPAAAEPLAAEHLGYRHRNSPYLGRACHNVVRRTFRRGETIFNEGRISVSTVGRLVTPDHR